MSTYTSIERFDQWAVRAMLGLRLLRVRVRVRVRVKVRFRVRAWHCLEFGLGFG